MSEMCMQVDPVEGAAMQKTAKPSTDWTLCILCQVMKPNEKLKLPGGKTQRRDSECSYKRLAENIYEFEQLGCVPLDIDIKRLDNGKGIEATLQENDAKFHKSCEGLFNNQKLQRAKEKKAKQEVGCQPSPAKKKLRLSSDSMPKAELCFFCEKDESEAPLIKAMSLNVDRRVREYAHILQDRKLFGKLSAGDLPARDAVYHHKCMTDLYNKVREKKNIDDSGTKDAFNTGLVLSELVSHIEEQRGESLPVFKLADLGKMYDARMAKIDPTYTQKVHTTRLKEKLLALIPDLRAHSEGRDIILMFDRDIGKAIRIACTYADEEVFDLMHAAKIVRRDILSHEYSFDGYFEPGCEKNVVPRSLLVLVKMILQGPCIKDQQCDDDAMTKIALCLSQLLIFNTKKTSREASSTRHQKCRETPFSIYAALLIHAKTRQRSLVDTLFSHGLCISYERTQELSTALANGVIKQFEQDGCVCPTTLRKGIFTVGAVDNIDHNTSSRTSKDSFHGTAVSIIQFPTVSNPGTERTKICIEPNQGKLLPLPDDYSEIPPLEMPSSEPMVPRQGEVKPKLTNIANMAKEQEDLWLETVGEKLEKDKLDPDDHVSWAAYHASRLTTEQIRPPSPIALLPLFTEQAHTAAMISHSMELVTKATANLNPGQVPVITVDQPLFAIAKRIQWAFPERFGESKIVIMMGGLHIEMNVMKLLGDLLDGSGWSSIVVQAGVTTSGRAEAILKGSHVTRSRYLHQVTSAALHILKKEAYASYLSSLAPYEVPMSFHMWVDSRVKSTPQFQYWNMVQELELLALQYIRSLREGNFDLYVECLGQLVHWMFSMDHTNYARWLPIHIRDMVQLPEKCPTTYVQFKQGHFVVQRSDHLFSLMALDQAHEQMNAKIKGDGGIIGLTENSAAMQKWATAGPEVVRITEEFENSFQLSNQERVRLHHDQGPSTQAKFAEDVRAIVNTFQKLENPFNEESQDLIALDTKEVMPKEVVLSIQSINTIGKAQYETFVEDRLVKGSALLTDIIPKNNVPLFQRKRVRAVSRNRFQISALKSNVELFSRMYIACQTREGNMDEFFRHENQAVPPALSDMGGLRACTKSDLIGCLHQQTSAIHEIPSSTAKILDGSVVVNMLAPKGCATFVEYADQVFLPYIQKNLEVASRLDIVWDRYSKESLKSFARQKRGSGSRIQVQAGTPIPTNWQSFLRVEDNKTDLYHFLAKYIADHPFPGKTVYSTLDTEVVPDVGENTPNTLYPSNHEEADTRLLLHAQHCAQQGHKTVLIRTVDTDVVVLAVSTFHQLPLEQLWIAFGMKKSFKVIPVHKIANDLGEQKSKALTFFHALTGCDTCSSFGNIGKRTAWNVWSAYPQATEAFVNLSKPIGDISDDDFQLVQRYVVLLYDRTSECQKVNELRKALFAKGRQLDRIPPTEAALREHVRRATFQGGQVWGQSLVAMQQIPSPEQWGWSKVNDEWLPYWTSLPEAAKSCQELIKCGCKKSCRPPCKCSLATLPCTELCYCRGAC